MANITRRAGGEPGKSGRARRSALVSGVVLGVGLMGAIDTIIFHQLLQWHNFYVHTTAYWRIVSDGLLHLATTALLAIGALRLWRDREVLAQAGRRTALLAGLLFGMGGFQLYDGIIHHKILQIHPIREGVPNQLPYDLVWNAAAIGLLAVGWFISKSSAGSEGTNRSAI